LKWKSYQRSLSKTNTKNSRSDFRTEIDQRFQDQNRSANLFFKPDPDFEMKITITNAIDKGKCESPQGLSCEAAENAWAFS